MDIVFDLLLALWQVVEFALQALIVGAVVVAVLAGFVAVVMKAVRGGKDASGSTSEDVRVRFKVVNSMYQELSKSFDTLIENAAQELTEKKSESKGVLARLFKSKDKSADKATDKTADKQKESEKDPVASPVAVPVAFKDLPKLFILEFEGDIQASNAPMLAEKITALLLVAKENDSVICAVNSGGGSVDGYGLCAAQLQRILDRKINLTVAVDNVAASGGYMMACVSNHLIAAPFAMVGSIGVIMQLPNFSGLMEKTKVDMEVITSTDNKRNLTMFAPNDDDDRAKAQQQIDAIHTQFVEHVSHYRDNVDWNKVNDGGYWTANKALSLGLVDAIGTSDDFILKHKDSHQMIVIEEIPRAQDKLRQLLSGATHGTIDRILSNLRLT